MTLERTGKVIELLLEERLEAGITVTPPTYIEYVSSNPSVATLQRLDEIEGALAVAAGQANRAYASAVPLIAQAIEEDLATGPGLHQPASWVAWQFGTDRFTATRLVALAERHTELPVTMAAFTEGRLSLDQAAAVAARVPAEFDAKACEYALVMTPAQLRRTCDLEFPPLPEDPEEAERRRSVRHRYNTHYDEAGNLRVNGCLPPDAAAVWEASFGAHRDALWNEAKAERGPGEPVQPPTNVDVVRRLAERSLDAEAAARPHSRRTRVLLHLDIDTKIGQLHGGPILNDAARRFLTCDATWQAVYERDGIAFAQAAFGHDIPNAIRTAVEHRDGGHCRVPGCTARHVQIHHIIHWEDGGLTVTWNLVAVCPRHHRLHHLGALGITGYADRPDGLTFTDPWGRTITATAGPPPTGPPPPDGTPYTRPLNEPLDLNWFEWTPPGDDDLPPDWPPQPDAEPPLDLSSYYPDPNNPKYDSDGCLIDYPTIFIVPDDDED